ncbi:hypothetical protein [Yokenella regensburgei]|jgi:hypothetical protein|uniref:hypothetical protein n=1 Tax=Yokenella regensburgei TaxID=158877 RepID=UPI001375C449|nr:hypothetical protein [Yokenella regensburgei]KAF1366496.1 hypothetical protein FHR25_005043 [Yokenella regensburgei]
MTKILKRALTALLLLPLSALAGEKVTLRCPDRGWAEVTFHLFQHVSVLWENNLFYISDARRSKSNHFYTFTNGDILSVNNGFRFIYADSGRGVVCTVLSREPTQALRLETKR